MSGSAERNPGQFISKEEDNLLHSYYIRYKPKKSEGYIKFLFQKYHIRMNNVKEKMGKTRVKSITHLAGEPLDEIGRSYIENSKIVYSREELENAVENWQPPKENLRLQEELSYLERNQL